MLYMRLALPENIRLGQKCMEEPELVKLQVSLTHRSCAQIVFQADFAGQGVSIRMLQWLDGARPPPKYHILSRIMHIQV